MARMFSRKSKTDPALATQPKIRLGVSARLCLAFATIVGLGVVSAWLTSKAFEKTSGQLAEIEQTELPRLVGGFELTAAAKSVVEDLTALQSALSLEELEQVRGTISKHLAELLDSELDDRQMGLVEALQTQTEALADIKATTLEIAANRRDGAEAVHSYRQELVKLATPLVDDLQFEMILGSEDILSSDDPAAGLDKLVNVDVAALSAITNLKSEINLAAGLLVQGASVSEQVEMVPVRERFDASKKAVADYLGMLPEDIAALLGESVQKILAMGEGSESLFEMRATELDYQGSLREIAHHMSMNVDAFVEDFELQADNIHGLVESRLADTRAQFVLTQEQTQTVAVATIVISALIMIFYVWRNLVRRLTGLSTDMREIASGNLEVEPAVKGSDEIASMAWTLLQLRDTAKRAREMRENLANEFEASVKNVISGVAESSRLIAKSSEQLESMARDVIGRSDSVNEISAQSLDNIQMVSSAAHQLAQSIAGIDDQLRQGSATTAESVDAANRTSATVDKLIKASEDIDNVRQVISDIAEQTNLLALNATIEAARAGEQGRGFAVVAQEVKTLAAQTASATEDIAKRIMEVQAVTKDATSAINTVVRSIQAVEESSNVITQSVREQSSATENIAQSVNGLETNGQRISDNIESVSSSANAAAGSVAELKELSVQLRGRSDELASSANAFIDGLRGQASSA